MRYEDGSAHHKSLFERIFSGSERREREEKVEEYIIYRLRSGAHLKDIVQEEYVHHNCSQHEIDEVIRDPRLVHEARTGLEELFESDELDPDSVRRRQDKE